MEDSVFVFGSNLRAAHGRGAARFAIQFRGASTSVAEGLSGNSYAIPTKDADLRTLPLDAIRQSVARFLEVASANPARQFDVTRVGCGLAGYGDADILPMFRDAPPNCRLPYRWAMQLSAVALPPRVIIAGSRTVTPPEFPHRRIDRLLSQLVHPVIVGGDAPGADRLGEQFAVTSGLEFMRCPAEWERYGRVAGYVRNQHMSFLSSHLIAIWDGASPGTKNMIETAMADGLSVRVIQIG